MKIRSAVLDFENSTLTLSFHNSEQVAIAYDRVRADIAADVKAEQDRELIGHLRAGNKIQAIKRRREMTGEYLKEAKDYVDNLQAQYGL